MSARRSSSPSRSPGESDVDGVPLRDRAWLSLTLQSPTDDDPPGAALATQLRVARHTERLAEVVAFYRDGLGLIEIGGFRDHDGYDGVFLAVPGTDTHLEFTTGGGHGAPAPHRRRHRRLPQRA